MIFFNSGKVNHTSTGFSRVWEKTRSPELLFSRIHRENIKHPLLPRPPHELNFYTHKRQFLFEEKYWPCSSCLKTGAVAVTASSQSTGSPDESSFSLTEFISLIFTLDNFNSVSTVSSSCFSFSMMLSNFVLPSFNFSPTLNWNKVWQYRVSQ